MRRPLNEYFHGAGPALPRDSHSATSEPPAPAPSALREKQQKGSEDAQRSEIGSKETHSAFRPSGFWLFRSRSVLSPKKRSTPPLFGAFSTKKLAFSRGEDKARAFSASRPPPFTDSQLLPFPGFCPLLLLPSRAPPCCQPPACWGGKFELAKGADAGTEPAPKAPHRGDWVGPPAPP